MEKEAGDGPFKKNWVQNSQKALVLQCSIALEYLRGSEANATWMDYNQKILGMAPQSNLEILKQIKLMWTTTI